MIDSFKGKYELFSNFAPTPVFAMLTTGKAIQVPTAEHAYQMMKSLNNDWRITVACCETPGRAKRMGHDVMLRPDWDLVKLDVMRCVLAQKFLTNPPALALLFSTGDEQLIEGNTWHDNYWGICHCGKCEHGSNNLGKLLMVMRLRLKQLFIGG